MTTLPPLALPPDLGDRDPGRPDDEDGTTTFVFEGPADRVEIEHFMARFPAFPVFQQVGDDMHALRVRLPEGSRVEYRLRVTGDGSTRGRLDHRNALRSTNPFGENSVAHGPGYIEPWWIAGVDGPRGVLGRGFVESKAFGRRRSLHWYHPASLRSGLPLLVVHDGGDFIRHGGIVTVLDTLIATRVIPPVMAALIDPGERNTEYADDPRHARFVSEVVDAAIRRHRVDPDPARHVYVGSSLGAVAALATAWRGPSVGGLALLSGSFVTALGGPNRRGAMFEPVIEFMERFAAEPGRPAQRIYQACGSYEGLAPDHDAFTPVLRSTGAAVAASRHPDGHHWHNWRNRLGAALVHTLEGSDPSALGSVHP